MDKLIKIIKMKANNIFCIFIATSILFACADTNTTKPDLRPVSQVSYMNQLGTLRDSLLPPIYSAHNEIVETDMKSKAIEELLDFLYKKNDLNKIDGWRLKVYDITEAPAYNKYGIQFGARLPKPSVENLEDKRGHFLLNAAELMSNKHFKEMISPLKNGDSVVVYGRLNRDKNGEPTAGEGDSHLFDGVSYLITLDSVKQIGKLP